jgi:hypothetical protein
MARAIRSGMAICTRLFPARSAAGEQRRGRGAISDCDAVGADGAGPVRALMDRGAVVPMMAPRWLCWPALLL